MLAHNRLMCIKSARHYPAYTAQYGVWRDTDGVVVVWVGESRGNGRHAACPYHGGERAYRADFKKALAAQTTLRTPEQTNKPVPI